MNSTVSFTGVYAGPKIEGKERELRRTGEQHDRIILEQWNKKLNNPQEFAKIASVDNDNNIIIKTGPNSDELCICPIIYKENFYGLIQFTNKTTGMHYSMSVHPKGEDNVVSNLHVLFNNVCKKFVDLKATLPLHVSVGELLKDFLPPQEDKEDIRAQTQQDTSKRNFPER